MGKKDRKIKRLKKRNRRLRRHIAECDELNEVQASMLREIREKQKRWICAHCNLLVPKVSVDQDDGPAVGDCKRCGDQVPVVFRVPGEQPHRIVVRMPTMRGARIG